MKKQRVPRLGEFAWPPPEDDCDETVITNVREYGCHIVGTVAEEFCPSYVFSIGLFANYGQPEIVVFGPQGNKWPNIINEISRRTARGERYFAGDRSREIIEGVDGFLIDVPYENYAQYLGYGTWFYRSLAEPFPCLQLVWPDENGKYPWDADCDGDYAELQPVLACIGMGSSTLH